MEQSNSHLQPKKLSLLWQVLVSSLVGAFLITFVLDGGWVGLGVLLRSGIIISAVVYFMLLTRRHLSPEVYVYLVGALVLSFFQVIRLSGVLQVLNSIAIVQLTLLALLRASANSASSLAEYLMGPWLFIVMSVRKLGGALVNTKPRAVKGRRFMNERRMRVIRGIGVTVPFLIIFGLLFASADAVFADALSSIFGVFDINLDALSAELFLRLTAWTFLTILSGALFASVFIFGDGRLKNSTLFRSADGKDWSIELKVFMSLVGVALLGATGFFVILVLPLLIGAYVIYRWIVTPLVSNTRHKDLSIELRIFLVSLNLLFLTFVGIQIVYLFGGANPVLSGDLTHAEYSRRGFFELLAVSFLVYLIAYKIYNHALKPSAKIEKGLLFALIAQVAVVMLSAIKRLGLYEGAFGFTELRFYSHSFVFFLAFVFGLWVFSVIRKQQRSTLLFRVVVLSILYIITLNIFNPDLFIARQNVDRYLETGKIDSHYISSLSQDAISQKLRVATVGAGSVEGEADKEMILRELCRWSESKDAEREWRSWNNQRKAAVERINHEVDCVEYRDYR